MKDIVFVDIETLGLDPDAPVWEFAAVRCTPGLPVQTREFFIEHDPHGWLNDLPAAFLEDYGRRYSEVMALSEGVAVEEIHFITNGTVVIGSNPAFDAERLSKLMHRNGIEPAWHYHLEDISSMAAGYLAARGVCPPRPWKSDMLSKALGVDPALFKRHTAMGDVRWVQAQYRTMMSAAHSLSVKSSRPA